MALIPLKHPITVNGEPVDSIEIPERLKLKHLRAMDQESGEIGKIGALIGAMASLPRSAVDEIDAEDFGAIADNLNGFLSQLPSIGGM